MNFNKSMEKRKSIFRRIFVPLIFIMILQSTILYVVAIYGGIEKSLNQNAVDILSGQVTNQKNEIETKFNTEWTSLDNCEKQIFSTYSKYKKETGSQYPLIESKENQVDFLGDLSKDLINTLRENQVNGIFLILNDSKTEVSFPKSGSDRKYGLCIRDMDQQSEYTGTEDLLILRSPSSIVETTKCSLGSWWEAYYNFDSQESGKFFYEPLKAAWKNKTMKSNDLAYFCGAHKYSETDQTVVSYSIPLKDENGYPYAVLGVELTSKYLASELSVSQIGSGTDNCFVLATYDVDKKKCTPIVANGSLFNRCFSIDDSIDVSNTYKLGGFTLKGRNGTKLYGTMKTLDIYNNNNPFEKNQLVLMAISDKSSLFSYSTRIKITLLWVTIACLLLGVAGIYFVSRRFSKPIKALADKARTMKPEKDIELGYLGITEIDQMVDSIEELSKNVNKEIARTEFFSRMSHDMRTPMNAIIGFSSEELLEGADEKQMEEYLSKIHGSGQYLLGLINEVLDMTKIESNKIYLQLESKRASEIWDTIIPMVDERSQSKNVNFVPNINCDDDLYINVDGQHLNQIVMNLLSNSVKFTPENGFVWLDVKMVENIPGKIQCTIQVRDTGIGMSEEFMKKLYTPFEQEHNNKGGTGLGLSISKKLVELMGGEILCVSELDKGTSFTVNLSFDKGGANTNESLSPDVIKKLRAESSTILKGKKILLCEDHPVNAQIASRLLEKKEMSVKWASDGKIALDMFENSEEGYFDAILMDIRMPVMDGLEATREIRKLEREDSKLVPIIAMTANAFAEDERESRASGMNAHLSKPIEPNKLYDTLVELFK